MIKNLHIFMLSSLLLSQPVMANLKWNLEKETQEIMAMIDQLQQKRLALGKIESVDEQKNAVLKNIEDVLEFKNRQIFGYMNLNRDLQKKLENSELTFTERLQTELKRRQIAQKIDHSAEAIESLEQQLLAQTTEIENLKSFIRDQETNHQESLDRLHTHIQQLNNNFARTPASQGDHAQLNEIRSLQTKLEAEAKAVFDLKHKLGLQDQSFQQLIKINQDLSEGLALAEKQIQFLKTENHTLHHKLASKESTIHELKRVSLEQQKQLELTQHQLLATVPKSAGRMPASQASAPWVHALKDKLIDESFEATLRPDGSISVTLTEDFVFNFGQTQLDPQHQARLHHFFKTYASTLFSDQDLKDKILAIEFIGHASPWYQSSFVDPYSADSEAYTTNLQVSLERAQELANYIFSEQFGDFPYKQEIRGITKVSGKSFSDPIPLRSPASNLNSCGGYDCKASRRVEIVFSFEPWSEEEFTP